MRQYRSEISNYKIGFGVFFCCALPASVALAEGSSLSFTIQSDASALASDANYVQYYQGQSDAVTATAFVNAWAAGSFYLREGGIADSKSDQYSAHSEDIGTIIDTALGTTTAASGAITTINVAGSRNTVFGTQIGAGGETDI